MLRCCKPMPNAASPAGAIYDALLAACAVKSGAATLYTWNVRHYGQLEPEVAARVKTP